ncbi:hypothetical protein LCGC14_2920780, partial [marine sediment metagenome]
TEMMTAETFGGTHRLEIAIPAGYEITPEPATMSLLAIGGLMTLVRRRRRA